MKIVYVAMSADFIHHGHMNIIEKARTLGKVVIGLLTDKAISEHKRIPYLNYKQRKKIISNIVGVEKIISQDTRSYTKNLKLIKPDFVVHGDDWKEGFRKNVRQEVVDLIKQWGGELVEVKYTSGVSATDMNDYIKTIGITPDVRRKQLRRLIESKEIVRIIEAHNGLTGLVAENVRIEDETSYREFDGMWASSLTDSTSRGKPDIEAVDLTSRLTNINDLMEVTTKPVIYDGDTGGKIEHFSFTVKTLERLGVSAIIIEDKIGLKKNSLLGTEVMQKQDSIENFVEKIKAGNKAKVTEDFMIIARIESLILKKGINDSIKRAKAYIKAGADGIMIHSKEKEFNEISSFLKKYNEFKIKVPIIVVPSTYAHITEKELASFGVNVVIYANQLLRSAYPAMKNTAELILKHQRALEASDENCMPIKEILTLIPGTK
tara:strand:- start:6441 stop:7742 length:1302 start_codon:yes stop_codon:yes gene_type:complete